MKKKKKSSIHTYARVKTYIEKLDDLEKANQRYNQITQSDKIVEVYPINRELNGYIIRWTGFI